MKYLFFVRNIRLVKVCGLWKQDPSSNWRCKIFKWFTEAYIKNFLVKLIFKTFTLENSKKKGLHILPRPGICNFCAIVPFGSSYQDSLFST
jgi:hypothetical protein